MSTFAFPSVNPASIEWALISNTQAFVSTANGTVQTAERPGARWHVSLRFNTLSEDNARTLIAFLVSLRGRANRFTLHDHALPSPRGVATGTPLVNGSGQTGGSLNTDGWTVSTTGILKAGDWIGFGSELHMLRADADSDASGNATLLIEPPIRTSPADNATITVSKPTATFMLVDDKQTWSVRPAMIYGLTINAVEAFA